MNPFDTIDPLILQLTTLRGSKLVIVSLIVICYMLKMLPGFRNKWIPYVNIGLGPVLCVFLVAWPDAADTWMQPLQFPVIAAWVSAIVNGILHSFIAWGLHYGLLKKWIDEKIPAWNGKTSEQQAKG